MAFYVFIFLWHTQKKKTHLFKRLIYYMRIRINFIVDIIHANCRIYASCYDVWLYKNKGRFLFLISIKKYNWNKMSKAPYIIGSIKCVHLKQFSKYSNILPYSSIRRKESRHFLGVRYFCKVYIGIT